MVRKSKLQISNHDVINDTLLSVKLCVSDCFDLPVGLFWIPLFNYAQN